MKTFPFLTVRLNRLIQMLCNLRMLITFKLETMQMQEPAGRLDMITAKNLAAKYRGKKEIFK